MVWLAIGVIGFGIGYLIEIVPRARLGALRPVLWAVSFGVILSAMTLAALFTDRYSSPTWLTVLGWATLPVGASLMLYTLLLELPFGPTFFKGSQQPGLVRTGTYALVRHPTVLWYLLLVVSLTLASRSTVLQVAAPVWLALDIVWILIQEKVSLPRTFPEYSAYTETTPMLLPTRRSVLACLKSIGTPSRHTSREVAQ